MIQVQKSFKGQTDYGKKYNIMKLEFSIFVYFIMFTKDLRIYFIFLPILLYIRYVHVN